MIEWKVAIFLGAVIAFVWKIWAVYFENGKLQRKIQELEQKEGQHEREDVRKEVFNDDLVSLVSKSNQKFGAPPRNDSE